MFKRYYQYILLFLGALTATSLHAANYLKEYEKSSEEQNLVEEDQKIRSNIEKEAEDEINNNNALQNQGNAINALEEEHITLHNIHTKLKNKTKKSYTTCNILFRLSIFVSCIGQFLYFNNYCNSLENKYNTTKDNYKLLNNITDNNYRILQNKYNILKDNYKTLENKYNITERNYKLLECKYNITENNYKVLEDKYNILNDGYKNLENKHNITENNYRLLQEKYNTSNIEQSKQIKAIECYLPIIRNTLVSYPHHLDSIYYSRCGLK